MSAQDYIVEIVVFTVKQAFVARLAEIRRAVLQDLRSLEGLLELTPCAPVDNGPVFADVVKWDSLAHAQAAAQAFERGDPRFLPYIEAIEEVKFMGHFKPEVL